MSLIHEALARAREEAARREALERGEAPPGGPPPDHYRFPSPVWLLALLGLAVLVGGVGLGRWLASSHPASPSPSTVPPAQQRTAREPTAQEPATSEPARPSGETAPQEETPTAALPGKEGTTGPAAGAEASHAPAAPRTDVETAAAGSPEPERAERASADARSAGFALPGDSTAAARSTAGAASVPGAARPRPQETAEPPSASRVDLGGGRSLELQGVVWNTVSPSAVINGTLMEPGESVEGFELVRIEPRTAVLSDGEREVVLVLAPGGG